MAVERISVQDEVYDFLLSQPTPTQIIEFRASEALQERVRYLLDKNRNDRLTDEENAEMDELAQIDHFMRGLKSRAKEQMAEKHDVHS